MEVKAEQKHLLISPKKLRFVADVARKLTPLEAVTKQPFLGKKGGFYLVKVIKSALANARNKGLSETDLVFKEIQISEGPRLKRGRPVSRGQWHPIKKRMSHIRVILVARNSEAPKAKLQVSSQKVNQKKSAVKKEEVKLKKTTKKGVKTNN